MEAKCKPWNSYLALLLVLNSVRTKGSMEFLYFHYRNYTKFSWYYELLQNNYVVVKKKWDPKYIYCNWSSLWKAICLKLKKMKPMILT